MVTAELANLEDRPRVVAIGNFDGVHRAHQRLVDSMRESRLRRTVITFDPHPRALFGEPVKMLSSLERRIELLQAAGAEDVLTLRFTPELAAVEPEAWIEQTLRPMGVRRVVVGPDFRFGRRRGGDAATLAAAGLVVDRLPLVAGVSSSRIRELVDYGSLEAAARLLGRRYELEIDPRRTGAAGEDEPAELVVDTQRYAVPPEGRYRATLGAMSAMLGVRRDPTNRWARVSVEDQSGLSVRGSSGPFRASLAGRSLS